MTHTTTSPTAWQCELMQEDGSVRTMFVTEDPDGLRFNDTGEPSPFKVTPLYALDALQSTHPADASIVGAQIDMRDSVSSAAPVVAFDDPRVQVVYDILCNTDDVPPPEQHWEGWAARRIVDALAAPAPAQAEPVAAPTVIYSPVATKPQIDGRHPNDNEPVDPERWYWLSQRGDDAGQGLDPYWKWGHSAGWNDHKKQATPPAAAAPLAQPLTDTRILEMAAEAETPAWGEWYTDEDALFRFARAVEAHKGQP